MSSFERWIAGFLDRVAFGPDRKLIRPKCVNPIQLFDNRADSRDKVEARSDSTLSRPALAGLAALFQVTPESLRQGRRGNQPPPQGGPASF